MWVLEVCPSGKGCDHASAGFAVESVFLRAEDAQAAARAAESSRDHVGWRIAERLLVHAPSTPSPPMHPPRRIFSRTLTPTPPFSSSESKKERDQGSPHDAESSRANASGGIKRRLSKAIASVAAPVADSASQEFPETSGTDTRAFASPGLEWLDAELKRTGMTLVRR